MAAALEADLRVRLGLGQVVVDLGGVGIRVQALAHGGQRARDEIGGALLAHAEHHGAAHVKGEPLAHVVPRAAAGDDVPAGGPALGCYLSRPF